MVGRSLLSLNFHVFHNLFNFLWSFVLFLRQFIIWVNFMLFFFSLDSLVGLLVVVNGSSHLLLLNWAGNDLLGYLLRRLLWSSLLLWLWLGFFIISSFLLRLGGALEVLWNISLGLLVSGGSSRRRSRCGSVSGSIGGGGLLSSGGVGSSLIGISVNWIWVRDAGFAPSVWLWKSGSGGSSLLCSPFNLLIGSARKKWIRVSWDVGWVRKLVVDLSSVSLRSISLIFTEVRAIVGIEVP